jgi:hypothetical protein
MWDISCVSTEMFTWFVLFVLLVGVLSFVLGRSTK